MQKYHTCWFNFWHLNFLFWFYFHSKIARNLIYQLNKVKCNIWSCRFSFYENFLVCELVCVTIFFLNTVNSIIKTFITWRKEQRSWQKGNFSEIYLWFLSILIMIIIIIILVHILWYECVNWKMITLFVKKLVCPCK